MSCAMDSVRDPFKNSWKTFRFPNIKPTELLFFFFKAGLAASTFLLITLIVHLTLTYNQSHYHNNNHTSFKYVLQQQKTTHQPPPTNISHLLFGIGGSVATWDTRRQYSDMWWRSGVTRGFVWLDSHPSGNATWPETSPPYKVSGDTSAFQYTCSYGSRSAIRVARILKESFELGMENVRWFVMGDDDTVFFIDNLVMVLSKYDHNEMYYVGGNSESVEQDVIHFYTMAFGGGGFAISYPLAKELVRILDGCIDRYAEFYGSDQKIQSCISEIGVQVTKEPGFHQVDIRGNPYGLLASHPVAPLVSLHHLDYVDPIFPGMTRVGAVKKLVSAYEKDTGRTLQKSFCYDLRRNWSVSVSWGYSVEIYPSLRTAKELETAFRTFRTWRSWSDGPFTFNTRTLSSDPCEKPVVYMLDQVLSNDGDTSRSIYRRYEDSPGNVCTRDDYAQALDVQYVDVFASRFTADVWKKAPRRQCCEVMKGSDRAKNNSVVGVKIRGCHRFESVTPL
ncbi:uncharacterized protein LOC106758232 [Vigna radiata var. radiata]|uniref:Uncharacterized protein LOC106758232 n=1 Tax=Vigna radiata var. radiata TaxID=3916 RepID=A0A1S3TS97_VIGRR|nr:uncharacterized protein LOC106758232 [Vigna radiata var. radiata]